jgi:hypothetical protein
MGLGTGAAEGSVTRWQLSIEARLAAVEQRIQADNVSLNSRPPAARPPDAVVLRTRALWAEYLQAAEQVYGVGSPKLGKLSFCRRHRISEREFYRCFSLVDQRGIGPEARSRYDAMIVDATRTLAETHVQPQPRLAKVAG